MLELRLLNTLAHKNMIQFLGVHVEEVSIPLYGLDFRQGVDVAELRHANKCLERLNEGEFVAVASHDDLRFGVFVEYCFDEVLIH